MSHPEFLFQKFEKRGCRERSVPAGVAGCPRNNLFFARRLRRRAGREKRGTAPRPSQRAGCPLQSRLSSCLTRIERRFEKFEMTHTTTVCELPEAVRKQKGT